MQKNMDMYGNVKYLNIIEVPFWFQTLLFQTMRFASYKGYRSKMLGFALRSMASRKPRGHDDLKALLQRGFFSRKPRCDFCAMTAVNGDGCWDLKRSDLPAGSKFTIDNHKKKNNNNSSNNSNNNNKRYLLI